MSSVAEHVNESVQGSSKNLVSKPINALLRTARVAFGFIAAWQVLTIALSIFQLQGLAGNEGALAVIFFKGVIGAVFAVCAYLCRLGVNYLRKWAANGGEYKRLMPKNF